MTLHPDDLLFFVEVQAAMQRVAKQYDLPLRGITAYPMPRTGMANRLGDCSHTGDIRLVLRCTVDGVYCDDPMSPGEVWNTAAHELAHLRYMAHGDAHEAFTAELAHALTNLETDHREKVIAKLVKMQASREGEAKLGNSAAAEAFASAINRMLLENELHPSDLDYARGADRDPVIEVVVDRAKHGIGTKHTRVAWTESLARTVAKAHLCTFLVRSGTNNITFVGTASHATVAEYAYGVLVVAADKMSQQEYVKYWRETGSGRGAENKAVGFRSAWLTAFIQRISERFTEAREAAVAEAPDGPSMGLMRLEGALVKARAYTDTKFKGHAAPLQGGYSRHDEGRARGRAAADRMAIGRRGVTGSTQKLLGRG